MFKPDGCEMQKEDLRMHKQHCSIGTHLSEDSETFVALWRTSISCIFSPTLTEQLKNKKDIVCLTDAAALIKLKQLCSG